MIEHLLVHYMHYNINATFKTYKVITHFLDSTRTTKSLCDTTPSIKYSSGSVYLCTPDGVILPLFKCRITSIVNAKAECKRYKYGTIQKANDVINALNNRIIDITVLRNFMTVSHTMISLNIYLVKLCIKQYYVLFNRHTRT